MEIHMVGAGWKNHFYSLIKSLFANGNLSPTISAHRACFFCCSLLLAVDPPKHCWGGGGGGRASGEEAYAARGSLCTCRHYLKFSVSVFATGSTLLKPVLLRNTASLGKLL